MKYLIATIIAAMCAATTNADAIYRCEVVDVSQLEANGKLAKTDWAKTIQGLDEVIIFDSESGLFRYSGESGSFEFTILQQGSTSNAMKAARIRQGPASAVMETIQIQTFAQGEFIYVAQGLARTGKCDTL
ncbi:MAG: hypothetical protein AAFR51_02075 [Pseudomonadota bacterium]